VSALAIDTERKVIDELVALWNSEVRPHVVPNACVLAARITSEVLGYFDIKHDVISMAAMAMNDKMLAHENEGRSHLNWDEDAYSVGVGFGESAVWTRNDSRDGRGFDGHVVVVTKNFYIDLTAYQFDRPQFGIETSGSLVAPLSDFVFPYTLSPNSINSWYYLALTKGHMVVLNNQNNQYKNSPDWKIHYKRQTGDIIRTIRQNIPA
jgi:hypothetical protein